jgi:hypothetical protein
MTKYILKKKKFHIFLFIFVHTCVIRSEVIKNKTVTFIDLKSQVFNT